jgi:hypothetical protein
VSTEPPRTASLATKDRRLLDLLDDKGDAAPPAPVDRVALDTAGAALDREAVERAVDANRSAFGACVTRAVRQDPALRVADRKATLLLTIQPTGAVSDAWVAEADLERTALGRCLAAAARRIAFPAFRGDALDVSVPLALSAIR